MMVQNILKQLILFLITIQIYSQTYFDELYENLDRSTAPNVATPNTNNNNITQPKKNTPQATSTPQKKEQKKPILITQNKRDKKQNDKETRYNSKKKSKKAISKKQKNKSLYLYLQLGLGYYGEVTLGNNTNAAGTSQRETRLIHGMLIDINFLVGKTFKKKHHVGFTFNTFLGIPFIASGALPDTTATIAMQSSLDIRNFFALGIIPGVFYQIDTPKVFSFYVATAPFAPIIKLQTNQLPSNGLDIDLDLAVAIEFGFGFRFSHDKGILLKMQTHITYLEFLYDGPADTGVNGNFSTSSYIHIHNTFTIAFFFSLKK